MIGDTVVGAVYISIIDMILLVAFLYAIGLLIKLLPMTSKILTMFRRGHNYGNN